MSKANAKKKHYNQNQNLKEPTQKPKSKNQVKEPISKIKSNKTK
jgi:hypothetical protein